MINTYEARIEAWMKISALFGNDYFRSHFNGACQSFSEDDNVNFIYFIGFEDDGDLWTVFAKVNVNRETKEVTFLDYITPNGKRMEHSNCSLNQL